MVTISDWSRKASRVTDKLKIMDAIAGELLPRYHSGFQEIQGPIIAVEKMEDIGDPSGLEPHSLLLVKPDVLPDILDHIFPGESVTGLMRGALRQVREDSSFATNAYERGMLRNFLPSFHSGVMSSILPFEPELGDRLADLCWEGNHRERYFFHKIFSTDSEDILDPLLLYLMFHERYGHGFFFSETEIGKRYAEIRRSGDYPEILRDSLSVLNEGFAVWMGRTFLTHPDFTKPGYGCLRELVKYELIGVPHELDWGKRVGGGSDEYFRLHPLRYSSEYVEGLEVFERLERIFPNIPCLMRAMIHAGDIRFEGDPVEDEMNNLILDGSDRYRANDRLRNLLFLTRRRVAENGPYNCGECTDSRVDGKCEVDLAIRDLGDKIDGFRKKTNGRGGNIEKGEYCIVREGDCHYDDCDHCYRDAGVELSGIRNGGFRNQFADGISIVPYIERQYEIMGHELKKK